MNTQYTGDRLADTVAARSSTAAVAQDATVAQRQAELEQLAAMQAAKHHEVLPSKQGSPEARAHQYRCVIACRRGLAPAG